MKQMEKLKNLYFYNLMHKKYSSYKKFLLIKKKNVAF